ncbi:type I-E CRISPR-associated protein Cse2/CasB [Rhizomonospora bruguierae]|uniref:type I-E CRISPR-associated protein Cse2/CasB n=1 Tax=Rhizomonospora bruguierae TaxID=1581705 RepID=UPI0020C0CE35|nr:type I-E CRISPR-associated protein Cse2/CasB [Micromonospora sp. NBRC 107566]
MSSDSKTRGPIDTYDRFVRHVTRVCQDVPERRASLRRGLGRPPEQAYGMHATVAQWLPDPPGRALEYALYSVASMIAAQSRSGRRGNDTTADADPATGDTAEHSGADPDTAVGVVVQDFEPEPDHSSRTRRPSLGTALAEAVKDARMSRRAIGKATAEKRLHLLVRQDLPGVHRHLPGLVRHIRSLDVPVDWAQLIADLSWWDGYRDVVAKRWLQDYYRIVNAEE